MAVHDMDILERLRRSVTKGHEPTDADALAAIAEIARLQLANKQSMEMADHRSAENVKLRHALKHATAPDWDFLQRLLISAMQDQEDSKTRFWIDAIKELRGAYEQSLPQTTGEDR